MESAISLGLDILVVALLVPTIVFAVLLNNRLSALRQNREELARLVAAFNEATVRAETGIPRLRKASEDAARVVQDKMERSQILRDDLAFMVERAEAAAARLEEAVRAARSESKPSPRASAGAASSAPPPAAGAMPAAAMAGLDIESAAAAAERAAAAALRAAAAGGGLTSPSANAALAAAQPIPAAPATPGPMPPRTARQPWPQGQQPLGSALGSGLSNAGTGASGPGGFEDDDRSEAERELLRALQSVR